MIRLNLIVCCCLLALLPPLSLADTGAEPRRITVADYEDRVHAFWLGQIIGNIYGLSYEFSFIDEPGPDDFPYGYGPALERAAEVDGAFSDDDTDIEYMYLLQMERHGIEPSYEQLAAAWKHHVRDRVWVANRNALTLMHAGYLPPITGHRDYNPNWFQIDPQLVNEIWAVTAPGMTAYATGKSEWAARITSDGFGLEPTIHYAAMFAEAFFESDVLRLIDAGTAALPRGSRFAGVVEHMKRLHRQHPEDWQAAWREMADHYHGEFDYNRDAWPVVDAVLNGAAGILALLYGGGDVQRTLDMACALGFDADNQAATMTGLLGVALGSSALPEYLLFPLGRERWAEPFNDRYVNVSRHDLPDVSIRELARRTAAQGEKIILANGGQIEMLDGEPVYSIERGAGFEPPFEIPSAPTLLAEVGRPFSFRFNYSTPPTKAWISAGTLPGGLVLGEETISGTPSEAGSFVVELTLSKNSEQRSRRYSIRVFDENLARSAQRILVNDHASEDDIEVLRDGQRRGETFYNRADSPHPRINFYGYEWDAARTITTLVFNPGLPEEWGGWFTSLEVEYRDGDGAWRSASIRSIDPAMDLDNSQWLKGAWIDHVIDIEPVRTSAIRIIGDAGGIEQDQRNGGEIRHFTAAAELAVYDAVSVSVNRP
jgi:hypothetical protein